MSKTPRISFVVEGQTDFIVLDALVERFLSTDDYIPIQIQPPTSAYANDQGPLGGGWKGVLKWCENIGSETGSLVGSLTMANCDCLIIHADADIAGESDLLPLNLSRPCPPAKDTCDRIREHITSLLGGSLPETVVICIPAQCTEAWVIAALHPDGAAHFQSIECRVEVERLLIGKPDRLVRDKDGRARKQTIKYKSAADKIAEGWPHAVKHCPEAQRFETECRAALP